MDKIRASSASATGTCNLLLNNMFSFEQCAAAIICAYSMV